jgi:hypothetical protein
LAVAFTLCNYAVLTGYDQLGFVYLRRRFPRWQISMASFVGYAISNAVGFAVLSGVSARYRFYSRWGVTAAELSRLVPGAHRLNTAEMLQEAGRHVKLLQAQVGVLALMRAVEVTINTDCAGLPHCHHYSTLLLGIDQPIHSSIMFFSGFIAAG